MKKLVLPLILLAAGYTCYLLSLFEKSLGRGVKDMEEAFFRFLPLNFTASGEYSKPFFDPLNGTGSPASQPPVLDPVCYRRCSSYDNRIAFYGPLFSAPGAGLNDRRAILTQTTNLAAFLCAKLIVPAPHFMLAPVHNGGRRISKNLSWTKDFFDILYLHNKNTSVIIEQPIEEFKIKHDLGPSLEAMMKASNLTWIESSRNSEDIRKGLREAYRRVRDNHTGTENPFLWTIHHDFWTGHRKVIVPELQQLGENFNETNMLPIKCKGVFWQRSPTVSLVIKRSLERLEQIENSSSLLFGNLHLRRGDAINECNTSVAKVRAYLECSFGGFRPSTQRFVLTLSTDETSPDYIQKIRDVVESLGFIFVHLDALLWNVIQEEISRATLSPHHANNFILFMATQGVSENAQFYLERRRQLNCQDCADWVQEKLGI